MSGETLIDTGHVYTTTRPLVRRGLRTWALLVTAAILTPLSIFTLSYAFFKTPQPRLIPGTHKDHHYNETVLPAVFVGFSLSLSHAAAAITFSNATNLTIPVAVSFGDDSYRDALKKLSSREARHVRPPYYGCMFCNLSPAEQLRQLRRSTRKKLGMPATAEVGAISGPLSELVVAVSSLLEAENIPWNREALLVTPAIEALYDEDIHDIMYFLSMRQAVAPHSGWPYGGVTEMGCQGPYELQAAFAGEGFGICEHWQDAERCRGEKETWDTKFVLGGDYSSNGLILSRAGMRMAEVPDGYYNVLSSYVGWEAFSSAGSFLGDEFYWRYMLYSLKTSNIFNGAGRAYNISDVFMFGESAGGEAGDRLERVLLAVLADHQKLRPVVHRDDPLYVAAKGAAELAKRGMWWSNVDTVAGHTQLRKRNPDPEACPWFAQQLGPQRKGPNRGPP